MEPTYELRPTKPDDPEATPVEWYFVFKAGNGEILFTSEMYDSKENAKRGVDAIRRATSAEAIRVFVGEREGETFTQLLGTTPASEENIAEEAEES